MGGIRGVHIYQTFPPLLTFERLQQLAQRDNNNNNIDDKNKQSANLSNFDHESEFDAEDSVQSRGFMGGNASGMMKKLTDKLKNSNDGTENVSGKLNEKFL